MDSIFRQTWTEISLDALRHNWRKFRDILPRSMKMMGVVKANAYGHGAVTIAQHLEELGADGFGVAMLEEALQLRKAGIQSPIVVLGYTPPEALQIAAKNRVSLAVYDEQVLEAAKGISKEHPLHIHVKLDSGMGRIGLHEEKQAIQLIDRALELEHVKVEGLFTHYACADEKDKSYTLMQHERFARVVDHYVKQGIHFDWIHAGNSAAAIDTPELCFNSVRLGISMYGMYPSSEVDHDKVKLRPVMSLKTAVSMVKTLPPDSGVSYGAKYRTRGEECIITLPVGYGDGYSRLLSHKADVIVKGTRIPLVGTICMDQCMANASSIDDVRIGDEVILFGRQDDEAIPVEEIAELLGTINYEVTCMISTRVPRVYTKDGQVVQIVNPLLH